MDMVHRFAQTVVPLRGRKRCNGPAIALRQASSGNKLRRPRGLDLLYRACTSCAVPLSAGAWHIHNLSGALANQQQYVSVRSNLTARRIRVEDRSGSDVSNLDNVSMVTATAALATLLSAGALVHGLAHRRKTGWRR